VFIFGNVLITAGRIALWVSSLYMLIIFISAVISWFPMDPFHPFVRFLRQVTEPVYDRARRYLPAVVYNNALGVDFTPVIIFLVLVLLNGAVFQSAIDLGYRMK
jgi:YggT family protein